jgi:Domain of unknown function (DUF4386)
MMEQIEKPAPPASARVVGVIYLLYFLASISGELLIRGLVVSGDAATTAGNIIAHQPLFRLHSAIGLLANALYIALTALFYRLFKPVSRTVALLAAFFSLVGCTIQALGTLLQVAPFVILSGSPYLNAFKAEQLQALALLSFKLNVQITGIYLVFFGLFNLSIGYLIFRSTLLPRVLGALMALSGLGWLIFLYPPIANHLLPAIEAIGILAEASLMIWLLVKGVNEQPPSRRLGPTG